MKTTSLVSLLAALSAPSFAHAVPITWDFTALTREQGMGSFSHYGREVAVTGSYTFESDTPGDFGIYRDAILHASVSIGGDTYLWDGRRIVTSGNDRNLIEVVDCQSAFAFDCLFSPDLDQYRATVLDNFGGTSAFTSFQILAVAPASMNLLTSAELPATFDPAWYSGGDPYSLTSPYAIIAVSGLAPSGGLGSTTAYLTSLTSRAVPEPATAALFGLGLLGLAAARRRDRRQLPDRS